MGKVYISNVRVREGQVTTRSRLAVDRASIWNLEAAERLPWPWVMEGDMVGVIMGKMEVVIEGNMEGVIEGVMEGDIKLVMDEDMDGDMEGDMHLVLSK